MTLRQAVRMYVKASQTPGYRALLVLRDSGKVPPSFKAADLDKLAEMERFR